MLDKYLLKISSKKWIIFFIAQMCLFIVLIWQSSKLPDENFHLHVFHVPLGDALLIQSPQGHLIAIDGGIVYDNS